MKKSILFISAVVLVLVVMCASMVGCTKSNATWTDKDYAKMSEYYNDIKEDVEKCEEKLTALVTNLKGATFSSTFLSERYYYSTSVDNLEFLGNESKAGYDNEEKERGNKWLVESVNYTIQYDNGALFIKADVNNVVSADDYEKGNVELVNTYKVLIRDEDFSRSGGEDSIVDQYCIEKMYNMIFGKVTSTDYLEKYGSSAEKGFRLYTSMMQYTTGRAFAFNSDKGIDYDNVIDYTKNEGKTKFTSLEEVYDQEANDLKFALEGNTVDIAGDTVSFWDNYGEDLTYNFYKIAAVANEKVTITYSNKKDRIDGYEYYEETILPFYTRKSKFKTYNVIKAVVADYTHFVMNVDYKTSFIIPSSL